MRSAVSEMDQETAIDAQAGTIVTTVRNNRMVRRVTEPDGQADIACCGRAS